MLPLQSLNENLVKFRNLEVPEKVLSTVAFGFRVQGLGFRVVEVLS